MSRGACRYGLLAIDVDGTLLDGRGELVEANITAVRRAVEAGLKVVVCTGRGLTETRPVVERLGLDGPVVVAGGAMVADARTGETLASTAMSGGAIEHAVGVVHGAGHAALLLKDRQHAGCDFVVVTGEHGAEIDAATRWWFETMRPTYRVIERLADDRHPDGTLRVGTCVAEAEMAVLSGAFERTAREDTLHHSFPTVAPPGVDGTVMHVIEVFDARATKWGAVSALAASMGIARACVAAIGDQVNDLTMLRGAGLGIAMGNGTEAVKREADRVAPANTEAGVAFAIERLLSGEW